MNELVPASPVVTGQVLPEAEILASVSWDSSIDEPARNSVFEVTLASTPGIEAEVIAGDWIMLSRYVLHLGFGLGCMADATTTSLVQGSQHANGRYFSDECAAFGTSVGLDC